MRRAYDQMEIAVRVPFEQAMKLPAIAIGVRNFAVALAPKLAKTRSRK